MTAEITLLSAFLVGLLGSTHCIGMCGGIVGALTLGLKDDIRRSPWSLFPYLLAYNTGRIASYATAGAVVGFLSAQAWRVTTPAHASLAARIISGGFMIALGLYLSGWWPGLGALEKLGGKLWQRIEPYGRRFLPVNHPVKALMLGLVWGWLPCGMVYAALAWTLLAGSAGQGALLMLAFGLGTLPMLLALGSAARWFGEAARQPRVRQLAGALIVLFGVYTLLTPLSPGHPGHAGHAPPSDSAPVARDQ
jgi:sulfite exporter TauE/SafE